MQALQRWMYCLFLVSTCMRSSNYWVEKSAIHLLGTSRFSCSLAQWTSYLTSFLQTKSLKEQTKACPGQAKFENYLSQGQAETWVYFQPWNDQTLHFFLQKLIVRNSLEEGLIINCQMSQAEEEWTLLQLG